MHTHQPVAQLTCATFVESCAELQFHVINRAHTQSIAVFDCLRSPLVAESEVRIQCSKSQNTPADDRQTSAILRMLIGGHGRIETMETRPCQSRLHAKVKGSIEMQQSYVMTIVCRQQVVVWMEIDAIDSADDLSWIRSIGDTCSNGETSWRESGDRAKTMCSSENERRW